MEIFGFTLSAAQLWLLGICGALIMADFPRRFYTTSEIIFPIPYPIPDAAVPIIDAAPE
ncbi:MAG: hypothetical protein HY578_03155 [Nitrospinae bacterium]|nr:hypothetical protein [Nitrospinota bacterium]